MYVSLLVFMFWAQEPAQPMPDRAGFMAEFRKTLHTDGKLLSQYTYTEKETEITLDSKNQPKQTEINVYQVFHASEEWKTYRRQIVKKGVSLTEKELEKQDREEKERVAKESRKQENQSEEKRQQEKSKADKEERETLDDVFSLYDFEFLRRETIDGVSAIVVEFKPKPNFKPKTSDVKILQHIAGRAWISEDDHELARLEAEIIDPISIGAGLFAKLNTGSRLVFERHKFNGEIWLPAREEAFVNGRLLLLKGLNIHAITEYSDHKKYSVDTILNFELPQ